jgi:hypothetical protein
MNPISLPFSNDSRIGTKKSTQSQMVILVMFLEVRNQNIFHIHPNTKSRVIDGILHHICCDYTTLIELGNMHVI